jgi:hypothetical protein
MFSPSAKSVGLEMPADPERHEPGCDFGYTRYGISDALGAPAGSRMRGSTRR